MTAIEVDYEYHTKSRGWEWKQGGYAYETSLDVKVGDIVVVPSLWGTDSSLAAVARIDTDYTGAMRRVIRRANSAELMGRPEYKSLKGPRTPLHPVARTSR